MKSLKESKIENCNSVSLHFPIITNKVLLITKLFIQLLNEITIILINYQKAFI